jgi:hypothetical protein
MRRALPLVVAALAVLVLGSACGSDGGSSSSTETTVAGPTTSTTVPKAPANTVQEAVETLLRAWQNNDRTTALYIAHEPAVATLFSRPYAATQSRGCDEPGQLGSSCIFRLAGGAASLRLHVIGEATQGFVVDKAEFLEG